VLIRLARVRSDQGNAEESRRCEALARAIAVESDDPRLIAECGLG